MSFDVGTGEVLAAVVGVLGAWFTYIGVRTKARADKEATLPEGWKYLTSEMRVFFTEQLQERDKRIDGLEVQVEQRDERIDKLEEQVKTMKRKYRYSLSAIRDFRSAHPDSRVKVHQDVVEDL